MTSRALIVGRFQPFHFGHQKLIEWAGNDVRYLIIAIGSSQESYTLDNPFTASERREMINKSLGTRVRFEVLEIPDLNEDRLWVESVKKICPDFDFVYTNGEKEKRLFANAGYEVKSTPMFNKDLYNGTEIRKRMLSGRPWRDYCPAGTVKVIESVDGVGRLKRLNDTYNYGD